MTFGVSSSLFAANMSVKHNSTDYANDYPLAASVVHDSFYVDDGLCGADTLEEATKLQIVTSIACQGKVPSVEVVD